MSDPVRPDRVRWHPRGFNNGVIFGATCYGVRRLPARVSYRIGEAGTWLACTAMRRSTRALMGNLGVALGLDDERELRRLALRTYRHYARDTIDFIRSLSMTTAQLQGLLGEFSGEYIEQALTAGRGALAISAHFGSWELGGLLLRRLLGHPVSVVVRPETSPAVHRIRLEIRESFGIETIEVRQQLHTALKVRRLLAENQVVAVLLDRHLGKDRIQVEFFGRPALFLRSPALLGYETGAPLVPSFVFSREDGRVVATCGESIAIDRRLGREAAIQEATQRFATLLEVQIRRHPDCWYQFYDFWAAQAAAVTL